MTTATRGLLAEALLWAVALVAVAVVLAVGGRLVAWVVDGGSVVVVWKLAIALLGAAVGGGIALAALRRHANGG